MKNHDLIWARAWADLTQDQAAELMNVDRRTFGRWEAGTVAMPAKKWTRFLAKVKVEKKDIPMRRSYDADGYPVGFDKVRFDDIDSTEHEGGWGMFDALRTIEGDEFESRRRERHRLALIKFYEVCTKAGTAGGATRDAVVSAEMSIYEANLEKLRGTEHEYDREVVVRTVVFDGFFCSSHRASKASAPSDWLDKEIISIYPKQGVPPSVRAPADNFADLG